MAPRGLALLAMAMLVASIVPAPGGAAPPASDVRIEGEARTRDVGFCSPGFDAPRNITSREFQGGFALQLPHHACWAEWDVEAPGMRRLLLLVREGANPGHCPTFEAHVDGAPVGSTRPLCGPWGPVVAAPVGEPFELGPGVHRLRITYRTSPDWIDGYVDVVALQAIVPGCPTNEPPVVGRPAFPGYGLSRNLAWQGFPYTYEAAFADPEGDPLLFLWSWGGQTRTGGPSEAFTWPAGPDEGRAVSVWATDDPSARTVPGCPALVPWDKGAAATTWSSGDVGMATVPEAGESCVAQRRVPSGGTDAVVSRCLLEIDVGTLGSVQNAVERVDLFINGTLWESHALEPFASEWDALKAPKLRANVFEGCARMWNDIHQRVFCSAPWRFLSVA